MTYYLGIDLGTTYTAAATYENGRATVIDLSGRSATMPSIVFLDEEGQFLVGDSATRRSAVEPARAAQQFKRRFGDTTPLFLGGSPFSADALTAQLLTSVIAQVTQQHGGPPAGVALTYPANWGGYKLELLEQAIRQAGLSDVATITEPEAAVLHYAQLERVPTGSVVAVFDLGGGTFDAAVVRKTEDGTEFLGRPEGIERLGGIDFDEAVFAFVREHLGGSLEELDPEDPTHRTALERLRRECTDAKEALSADEVASIPVLLPNVQTTVRITRSEFESLVRPPLSQAIGALQRALESAGIEPGELDSVLLAGGSSRIPLVAEMVGSELARPVAVDSHPKHVVAMGAALAASQHSSAAPVVAAPVVAPEPAPIPEPEAAPAPEPEPTPAPVKPAAAETVTVAAASPPPSPPKVTASEGGGDGSGRTMKILAAVVAVVVLAAVGFFVLSSSGGDDDTVVAGDSSATTAATDETDDAAAAVAETTSTTAVTTTAVVTTTAAPVATTTTAAPTTTTTAAPTTTTTLFPPETRQAVLTGIVLNGSTYEVSYETLNFEPLIGSGAWHLHFHWNTFAPESVGAGANPQGSWKIWDLRSDGEMIFDGFSVAAAPADATAICVVVATDGHAVDAPEHVADTVSCVELPG